MDALDLLKLQHAWGAGPPMSRTPVSRLNPRERPISATIARVAEPTAAPPPGPSPAPPPATLDALRHAIESLDCPLRATATRVVLPDGALDAKLLLIGEAPDGDADETGRPYAGAAGATLAAWLASIGLARSDCMVMAAIPWRPPGARAPTPAEEALARPFVQHMLALSSAPHALLLGSLAVRMALDAPARPGTAVRRPPRTLLILPGVADTARRPAAKRLVWAGLRQLRHGLDQISP